MKRRLFPRVWILAVLFGGMLGFGPLPAEEVSRVLPAGTRPDDNRLEKLVDLNGYFPFAPPASKEAWKERSDRLRRQMLVATGLWPMPTKTPANAVVHGAVDRGEYTVEKVFLESFPGHFVTGSLYRPKGKSGRLPAVLCPHGHWPNGRFYDTGAKAIRQQIVDGAERFELSGRYPLQARCMQLARMGCLVFHYDMIGYADSVQLAHRAGLRPALNTPENWGYFSPQAEARLQHMMGLQTYNSVRALDWVLGRDDVDPQRIGVTGASGGGTQTFILGAVDPRPAVAFPAVMVSTAMQGGCTCENACYLRVGTGNIEIAALFAPRPLGMSAANDWTKEIDTKGLPELRQLYKLLGVEHNVMAKSLVHFPHNYNYVSRAVMYGWMNKHLKLGLAEPIVEEDFRPLSIEELTVWDEKHPKPAAGDDYERSLLKWITDDSNRQVQALIPRDAATLAKFRQVVGQAVDVLLGRGVPPAKAVAFKQAGETALGPINLKKGLIRYAAEKEELPAIVLRRTDRDGRRAVVWVGKQGKASLLDASGQPNPAVRKLLDAGRIVIGIDLFGQGEFTEDGKPWATQRINKSGRGEWASYAGYTFGYNYPLFAQRVHDVLSAVALARSLSAEKVDLVGLDGAGHWVLAARAQAQGAVDRAVADTAGFRFAKLSRFDDPDFLPGGAKYLDLPGMAALSAPLPLWLAGEGHTLPEVIRAAYQAAGKPDAVVACPVAEKEASIDWLLR